MTGGPSVATDVAWQLGERLKELTLLHEAARLLDGKRAPDAALLSELVALVPRAWARPELCEARIRWGDIEARTSGWRDTPWRVCAAVAADGVEGVVEVSYLEATTSDPFLAEERALVRSLGEMLASSLGRYQAEQRLRERESRLAFLDDLRGAVATAPDVDHMLQVVVRRLGEHLHASRVVVLHVERDGKRCTIPVDYADGCASLVGVYELTDFGAAALLVADGPVAIDDVRQELPADVAAKSLLLGVASMVVCSHVREGALRSLMAVQQSAPRAWATHEVELIADTVSRTWAAIEQRAAEERLRQNEALLRIAGEAARLGGWSIDLPDHRVTWSDEVCQIHDVPSGTVPTRADALAYFTPEVRDVVRSAHAACIEDGTPFDMEAQIRSATGKKKWVRTIGRAERNAAGRLVRIQGALQEIDDRRRLQEHLRQSQKMEAIGQLSAGIVHDFNNIISVIVSYSSLLIEEHKADAALCADLQEIGAAGQRASEITRQLLTFSRQQVHRPRLVDLEQVVAGIERILCRAAGDRVKIDVSTKRPLGQVLADPGQIEQVLMNLVVNARDAMSGAGSIGIEITNAVLERGYARGPHGRHVMVAVTDTGHGMDDATQSRIFEPFFTTKESGKGTGLGLAVVHGIVSQSGGHLDVVSALGEGTTFKVYFPEADGSAVTISPGGEGMPPRANEPVLAGVAQDHAHGEHILLVDDEEALVMLTTRVLGKLGYEVSAFTDPNEALRAFRQRPEAYHAVVTDVRMLPITGFDLVRAIRQQNPSIPVVLTSGCFRHDDVVTAESMGLQSMVIKPHAVEDLGRVLHQELQARASEAARVAAR